MSENPKIPPRRRPLQYVFLVALLGVPALLVWFYFAPKPQGEPTFETLRSESDKTEKTQLEIMEEMWEHSPGHGPIALELGNLYLEDGQYRRALEFFNTFLKDDTSATGWEVRLDMSRAYMGLMMKDSALAQLSIMLRSDPEHAGALYNLGAIEANSGNFAEAREAWQKLITAHPRDTLAVFAKSALPRLNKPDGHP